MIYCTLQAGSESKQAGAAFSHIWRPTVPHRWRDRGGLFGLQRNLHSVPLLHRCTILPFIQHFIRPIPGFVAVDFFMQLPYNKNT